MDVAPGNDPNSINPESPELTLARTRHLIARARATLDDVTKRLEPREDLLDTLPHVSDSLS